MAEFSVGRPTLIVQRCSSNVGRPAALVVQRSSSSVARPTSKQRCSSSVIRSALLAGVARPALLVQRCSSRVARPALLVQRCSSNVARLALLVQRCSASVALQTEAIAIPRRRLQRPNSGLFPRNFPRRFLENSIFFPAWAPPIYF